MLLKSKSVTRELTMMVVPHYDSPVRMVRIPLAVIYGIVILAVFGVSMLGFSFREFDKAETLIESLRQSSSKRLVDIQRENLHILNNRLTRIQNQYAVISQFIEYAGGVDKDVRAVIGVNSADQSWEAIMKENKLDYQPVPKPASNEMPQSYSMIENEGKKLFAAEAEWVRNLQLLKLNSEECKKILEHTPSGWPAKGRLSSPFGYRDWTQSNHLGVDIVNVTGTPLHATASGKIVRSQTDYFGYGTTVDIDHGGGIMTRYAHCDQLLVKVGESVKAGQVVATMGNTGNSQCPHIHYEIRINGNAVDPEKFPF